MGLVKAKRNVYLAPEHGGYKKEGDVFNYDGPDNEHLEAVKEEPYSKLKTDDLRALIAERNIVVAYNAKDDEMRNALVEDDNNGGRNPFAPVVGDTGTITPYGDLSTDDLKAEVKKRKLTVARDTSDADLRDALKDDDAKKKQPVQRVEVV